MKEIKETLFCDICGEECKLFIRNVEYQGAETKKNWCNIPMVQSSIKMEYVELDRETRLPIIKRDSQVCKKCQKETLESLIHSFE